MSRDDKALIDAARAGDPRALDELLALHERPLYRFGLRMCGSEDAAKDVLQQTLLAAFRRLNEFRGDASLSTWLFQIAHSFCVKAQRRRAGEPSEFESLEAGPASSVAVDAASPEDVAHARQLGEAIQAAMLALPEKAREVLVLRDVEGLSAEEAAQVLGIEVRALKSRLHRARMALREQLAAVIEPTSISHACPELARELSEYAAEEIDQATCVRIEAHLQRCSRCASACEALKKSVSLCRSIPGEEVPQAVRAAVRRALAPVVGQGPR